MTSYLESPKPVPAFDIPASSSTVTVRAIDSVQSLYIDGGGLFWTPRIKGFEGSEAPVYCFLISNGDRHIIFDLGIRSDWDCYAPEIVSLVKKTTKINGARNISEVLDTHGTGLGVRSQDIEAIIWSHNHFDHIGDPSCFPPSTDLVVGPGFKEHYSPGYPINPKASILESDIRGRVFREIDFQEEGKGMKIGRFSTIDFFGNGSFYLLDAPGHSIGHLCGFARVTSSPDSFVLLGADACHHAALFRPTDYLPLPTKISPSPIQTFGGACPGAMLQHVQPRKRANEPFLTLSKVAFPYHDDAQETLEKIKELDAVDNIFVIISHDKSLKGQIEEFPKSINDWKSKGLKPKTRWLFCKDFDKAVQGSNERNICME
ncbi:hypothetical protein MMC29_002581 [Sticta canariensis]|nr:hypothetical protein [Sticta canariensis]